MSKRARTNETTLALPAAVRKGVSGSPAVNAWLCPTCGAEMVVTQSRPQNTWMKRRRICLAGHRFTTHEVMADQSPIGAARDAIEKIRNHLKSIRELLADIESEDHGES